MEKLTRLFEPGKIGKLQLKNRIIMSPMGGYPTINGYTAEQEIAMWKARAKGGVALIHKTVWPFSPAFTRKFGRPYHFGNDMNIADDAYAERAEHFTRAIKAHGVRVACFVSHPGRQIITDIPEYKPFAPSAIKDPMTGLTPRELSRDEIKEIVDEFAEGVKSGKNVGFEAVMIQGGHGYLIHQFLTPRANRRTDEYGGSVENRARFSCEIIKRIREKLGPDFPIIFRMNGDDYLAGGITREDAIQHALLFEAAGADALDVSAGPREAHHWQFITHLQPYGALIHLAAAIKKVVKVPVCTVGKIDPVLAEHTLSEGSADFVDFLRSLLTDPEWPNKAREGRLEDIRPCIYCNQCLNQQYPENKRPERYCSVNPAMSWEQEYTREMQPAPSPKKVIVAGGGLAGMEAARTLAERGHAASLYEKSSKLGGQWNIVSTYHADLAKLSKYLAKELEKAGVKVFLNQEVTPNLVKQIKPDAVVVATGAKPAGLNVPGSDGKNVVQAVDVLTGKVSVGKEAVIIGGRGAGLDTALFLAGQGTKVSVVEMQEIAWGFDHILKLIYWENLAKYGVPTYPHSIVDSVTENGVNIICDGEILFLKADTVVLAVGSTSEHKLAEQLKGLVSVVYAAGDSVKPRSALEAIHEGSSVGRRI